MKSRNALLLALSIALMMLPCLAQPALGMPTKAQGSFFSRLLKPFRAKPKPAPKPLTPAETLQLTLRRANPELEILHLSTLLTGRSRRYVGDNYLEYCAVSAACKAVVTSYNHAVEHKLPLQEVRQKAREVKQAGAALMSQKVLTKGYTPQEWIDAALKAQASYKLMGQILSQTQQ